MKMNEMADLLSGLASTFENVLKQGGAKDLQTVSECFRLFGDENVAAFCKFVMQAKEGKKAGAKSPVKVNDAKVDQMVSKIEDFLENRRDYDYPELRQIAADIGKLKNAEIKQIGDRLRFPVDGTKSDMIGQIEDWLVGIKMSADQSSFSTVGTGTS